jgi:hypothetical protein
MMAGGNWWRANEIVMRHLTRLRDARYRSLDKAAQSRPTTRAKTSRDTGFAAANSTASTQAFHSRKRSSGGDCVSWRPSREFFRQLSKLRKKLKHRLGFDPSIRSASSAIASRVTSHSTLLRKLLKKQGLAPDVRVTYKLRWYGAATFGMGLSARHEQGCGGTIGLRIRINRFDDASGSCSVSDRPDQPNDSCLFTSPSKTLSTPAPSHIPPHAPRPPRRSVREVASRHRGLNQTETSDLRAAKFSWRDNALARESAMRWDDRAAQDDLMATFAEMPRSPGHAFYDRLQELLREADFDGFVEEVCKPFYAAKMGTPSLPPGRYFRMHMIGYFEGLDSERGIAWCCADSYSLRDFLPLSNREKAPDHSWLSRTRSRLPHEAYGQVCSAGS